ncbi:hypothetical protein FIV50_13540 [Microbacterium foliorum]|uniref:Transcriptional regulator, AbiEi antitoxin, Type IV TA system n=1 Tax=Microbacterium foliorum TaxID=104336 RepID=A0A4Y5YSA4_9MICO|nr:hypothetical protein [Microbacterium foliorum]QDE35720.1 hypothetical protein FIV50_13540 [Microbacterium foliorum]
MQTLADRAFVTSPVPLIVSAEMRMLGLRAASPRLRRVRSGVHARQDLYDALRPWQRYAARVHAFVRTHPGAVLCLESAAVLHGLPHFGETALIHVLADAGEKSRRFGDVAVHSSMDSRGVTSIAGIHCTDLLDTAVDLTRVLSPARGLAVADAAMSPFQGGDVQRSAADETLGGQMNSRGRARARWAWTNADGRSESPGESVSRAVIEWCGFETPQLQAEFAYEGAKDRADFFFPSCRVIGEADGWGKYDLDDPDAAAQRLSYEKRREDRLRRNGHPIARWDLSDAWKVDPLRLALVVANVPLVRPPQEGMLASLKLSPREVSRSRPRI